MDLSGLYNALEAILFVVITQVIPGLIGAAALLIAGNYALGLVVRVIVAAARRSRVKQAQIDLTRAAVRTIGWILILAGVLQSLGLNQIALALGGSISLVALGVATAASGNLGDIIAGVFLASDPDFGTGFRIKSGDVEGVIEQIDLRKTRIRTEDGTLHVVPNKDIESKVWIVQTRPANAPPPPLFRLPGRREPGKPGQPEPPM